MERRGSPTSDRQTQSDTRGSWLSDQAGSNLRTGPGFGGQTRSSGHAGPLSDRRGPPVIQQTSKATNDEGKIILECPGCVNNCRTLESEDDSAQVAGAPAQRGHPAEEHAKRI